MNTKLFTLLILSLAIASNAMGQNSANQAYSDFSIFTHFGYVNFDNSSIVNRRTNIIMKNSNEAVSTEFANKVSGSFSSGLSIAYNPFKLKSLYFCGTYWQSWIKSNVSQQYNGEFRNYYFEFDDNIFFQTFGLGMQYQHTIMRKGNSLTAGVFYNVMISNDFSTYTQVIDPNQGVDNIMDFYNVPHNQLLNTNSSLPGYIELRLMYSHPILEFFELFGGFNMLIENKSIPLTGNFGGNGLLFGFRTKIQGKKAME